MCNINLIMKNVQWSEHFSSFEHEHHGSKQSHHQSRSRTSGFLWWRMLAGLWRASKHEELLIFCLNLWANSSICALCLARSFPPRCHPSQLHSLVPQSGMAARLCLVSAGRSTNRLAAPCACKDVWIEVQKHQQMTQKEEEDDGFKSWSAAGGFALQRLIDWFGPKGL